MERPAGRTRVHASVHYRERNHQIWAADHRCRNGAPAREDVGLSYQVGILQSVTKKAEADAQALSLKKIQLVATAVKDTTDAINNARELIGQNKLNEAGPFLQKALDRMIRLTHEITQ
jgi:hypothetical protein